MDVHYRGKTACRAIGAIDSECQPLAIRLVALIDREEWRLPVRPDVVGMGRRTSEDRRVAVRVVEIHGTDGVWLLEVEG